MKIAAIRSQNGSFVTKRPRGVRRSQRPRLTGRSTVRVASATVLMGQPLAHERGRGTRGNREVPPHLWRRGLVGETGFPPRERAKGERRSCRLGGLRLQGSTPRLVRDLSDSSAETTGQLPLVEPIGPAVPEQESGLRSDVRLEAAAGGDGDLRPRRHGRPPGTRIDQVVLALTPAEPEPVRRAAGRHATVPKRERAAAWKADDRSPADADVTTGRDEAVACEQLQGGVDGEALDDAVEIELRARIAEDERACDANVAPASGDAGGRRTLVDRDVGEVAIVASGFDGRARGRVDETVRPRRRVEGGGGHAHGHLAGGDEFVGARGC